MRTPSRFAIELADALRGSKNPGFDAPVFVAGKNLQTPALVADYLAEVGYQPCAWSLVRWPGAAASAA